MVYDRNGVELARFSEGERREVVRTTTTCRRS